MFKFQGTVVIVNIYFRSALSHKMPTWVRKVFLEFLPHLLVMKRPERIPIFNGYFVEEYCASEIFDASEYRISNTLLYIVKCGPRSIEK